MSMCKTFATRVFVGLCGLLLAGTSAHAGLAISGTRVIYEEAQGETTVNVRHADGDDAVLVQAWIDDGAPDTQPGQQTMPFILTPAVALMEPGGAQVIRVLRTGELPQDRESLFFFNVLEVPPDASDKLAAGQSFVQFAMQARLKFFYRPRGLQPSIDRAYELLSFAAEPDSGGKLRVRIKNPTPYHFTFSEFALVASDAEDAPKLAELDDTEMWNAMIEPASELVVPLKAVGEGQSLRVGGHTLRYTFINDQGGKGTLRVKLN